MLSLKRGENLSEGTKFKIQKIVETKPRELVKEEQAMIMEIVSSIGEVLEEAAESKAAGLELPSLEEERAAHEVAAAKLAEDEKHKEQERKQMEDENEAKMLEKMVQDQLDRQKAKAMEIKRKNAPPPVIIPSPDHRKLSKDSPDLIAFDRPIHTSDSEGNPFVFQAVTGMLRIRQGPVSTCFTVRPLVEGQPIVLVLKQTQVKDRNQFKHLQSLEHELEKLKAIHHQNILLFLDFKIIKTVDDIWTISILVEYAEKGSLEEFLDIVGSLAVNKVRSWTIELLDALRFLHEEHGIIHEDIHPGNVLLVRESGGQVRPKFGDAGYQRRLHNITGKKHHSNAMVNIAKSAYWWPPEVAAATLEQAQYTQKTDVWDFGVMFLQMAFGLNVVQRFSSPKSLTESLALSDALREFLLKLFNPDPKKRPRAFQLGSCSFLVTDAPIMEEDSSSATSRLGSINSLTPVTPRRPRRDSTYASASGPFSRYAMDFVEEARLGKGGFGEVVKARQKLDGQIYAVKKITQKSSAQLEEVLKEARLLSQLNHPSVVRKCLIYLIKLYSCPLEASGTDAWERSSRQTENIYIRL